MPVVKVWIAGGLIPRKHEAEEPVVLQPRSTLRDLFNVLGLAPGPGVVALVDGRRTEPDEPLPDECQVTIFPHVSGGQAWTLG